MLGNMTPILSATAGFGSPLADVRKCPEIELKLLIDASNVGIPDICEQGVGCSYVPRRDRATRSRHKWASLSVRTQVRGSSLAGACPLSDSGWMQRRAVALAYLVEAQTAHGCVPLHLCSSRFAGVKTG